MTSPDPIELSALLTRRRALLSVAGGAASLLAIPAAIALASDDDDHDDDHDNSGSGNAEDRNDHDDHDDDGSGGSDDEGDVAPQGTVPPGSAEVRIVDDDADGFQPGTVTVDLGQQVTFVNLDDDPHTATGANFDTGIIDPGEQATVIFDQPGSFPYSCQIHPVMTGRVDVRDESGTVPATPEAATPAASPAAGSGAEVTIRGFAFEPPEIEVAAGTTVTWTNEDQVPHTATGADGIFDTGTIEQGQSGSHTFGSAGRFNYACAFHPDMTGVVVVT